MSPPSAAAAGAGVTTPAAGVSAAAVAAPLSVRSGQNWSVSAWADPATTGQYQDIISQDGTQASGFHLDVTSGGYWAFRRPLTDTASPSVAQAISAAPAKTSAWTFLTATFNATTGQMDLYVNGQLAATATDPTPFATSGPTTVGRGLFADAPTNWFDGNTSDVQGFDYTLTPSQTQALDNGNGQADDTQLSQTRPGRPAAGGQRPAGQRLPPARPWMRR